MCGAAAVPVMMAVSTAFAAKSALDQGRFAKGTARYNARVAENEAQETRRVGTEAENAQRLKTAMLLSKQRAQIGAAGVELGSGSALQLQEDTATLGEADALRIRSNFERKAAGLETGAELTLAQGEFAASAGINKATGTLLSGAASIAGTGVADKWFTPESAGSLDIGFAPTSLSLGQ